MNLQKDKKTEFLFRKSPSQTSKSPSQTSKSPSQTRKSPSQTSKSPPQTSKSPSQTRKSPSQTRKLPLPSYNSESRIFSDDIYMNLLAAHKIQKFIKDKIIINKNTLNNRINRYKILMKKLSQLKDGDCLEEKMFNTVKGYTIRNIINLEKQIGSESTTGSIYLTNIPNLIGVYPIATKVMNENNSNRKEVEIMRIITKKIILNYFSRHFLMIYSSSLCSPEIALLTPKLRYISVNELADGDLKMIMNNRDVLEDNDLMLNLLFQTYISIATFQNNVEYVHNDTHHGNFLFHYNNENIKGYYHYVFNEKDYYLKCCKYNIIIFDFGMAKNVWNEHNCINIHRDYKRILYAFMKKGKGWGIYDDLPKNETNIIVDEILSEMNNLYEKPYKSPLEKNLFSDIIENILLRYTPKDMFITERPSIILNTIPFIINKTDE
jgi:hypothetical protein